MSMKYVWTSIAIVAIIVLVVIGNRHKEPEVVPPQEATLAGPQEPVPTDKYDVNAPLSKNKVILQNGMKIEITKEGRGTGVENGDTVVMTYVGKFENGTVFDASKNHGDGTFSFALGAGQVIKGWDQGVLGMKVGESRTLTIPADLGYGPNDYGPIPGNSTLIFDITLLGVK